MTAHLALLVLALPQTGLSPEWAAVEAQARQPVQQEAVAQEDSTAQAVEAVAQAPTATTQALAALVQTELSS